MARAVINPKNVIINVLFSDTKSLKSHMFIPKITRKVSNTFILKLNTPFFSVKGVITP